MVNVPTPRYIGRQMRILIADDHEVVRKGVRAILTSHFIQSECIEASNGQDAISKAQASPRYSDSRHQHAGPRRIRRC